MRLDLHFTTETASGQRQCLEKLALRCQDLLRQLADGHLQYLNMRQVIMLEVVKRPA